MKNTKQTTAKLIIRRLNEYLYARNKSLYQFSKEACINLSTLKNLANGHTKCPAFDLVVKIANALGVTIIEFLNADFLSNESILELE